MPKTLSTFTHDPYGRLVGVAQDGTAATVRWSPDGHRLAVEVSATEAEHTPVPSACPACGLAPTAGARFCSACGAELPS